MATAAALKAPSEGWMGQLYPSTPALRALMRLPLFLWRLGLGRVLGHALMVLTTTGRRSGLPRRVVVEYHELAGRRFVPSAFGERAQWYRNVQADPRVTVQTARGVEHARARRVTESDELLRVYELFRRRNPVMLRAYLESMGVQTDPADVLAKRERIHWLTFEPTDEPTPPPLPVDLVWLWPAAALAVLGGWWLARWFERRP